MALQTTFELPTQEQIDAPRPNFVRKQAKMLSEVFGAVVELNEHLDHMEKELSEKVNQYEADRSRLLKKYINEPTEGPVSRLFYGDLPRKVQQELKETWKKPPPTFEQLLSVNDDLLSINIKRNNGPEQKEGEDDRRIYIRANATRVDIPDENPSYDEYGNEEKTYHKVMIYRVVHRNAMVLKEAIGRSPHLKKDKPTAFLVVDTRTVPKDNEHVRQYLMRTLIEAGRKEELSGLNCVIVWTNDPSEVSGIKLELHQRARLSDPFDFWKKWWAATYKAPTVGDGVLTVISVAAQVGIAVFASSVKAYMDPAASFYFAPTVLSVIFGTVLGFGQPTYRNAVNRGTKVERILKKGVVSAAFAYGLSFLTHNESTYFHALNFGDIFYHGLIFLNIFANNWAKDGLDDIPRMRQEVGANKFDVHFRLPYIKESLAFLYSYLPLEWELFLSKHTLAIPVLTKSVPIKWQSVEAQGMYLAVYGIRLLDLIKFNVWGLPIGRGILLASIAPMAWLSVKYAELLDYSDAKKMRTNFNYWYGSLFTAPATDAFWGLVGVVSNAYEATVQTVSTGCSILLSAVGAGTTTTSTSTTKTITYSSEEIGAAGAN